MDIMTRTMSYGHHRCGILRGHTVPADGLLVTPNPSAGDVTIILPPGRRDQALLWVYDAVGKLVKHVDVPASQRTVDVHGLDAGSYIVRLRNTHTRGQADLVQHFVVVP
ncbi:MAG: T9SS type A sorting domain-containing protein [Candidatus Kapabacteria bacterium]|nr:T9SS type A sorting domain-containing protein [Candidatus Kapabacteria bacterium]